MLTATIILSVAFILLGFLVTVNNAKYILSGYNTMSEADRAKMDIVSYLRFFKRFHLFLGSTLLAGFLILRYFNANWASVFLILYPLLSYIFLIAKGNTYYRGTSGQRAGTFVGIAILIVICLAVGMQLFASLRNSELVLNGDRLEVKGIYGIQIKREDIQDIELVSTLPELSHRSNGFEAGNFAKGSFRTSDGKTIRLFVNKKASPFLGIRTKSEEIFFSSDEAPSDQLLQKVRMWSSKKQ